jgi:hypothetical protein
MADLAAASLTAKWKDATTLEITGTIKNTTRTAFKGPRQVRILVIGGDGKLETAKEETIPTVAANGSHKITFNTTASKYFDIGLKWSLELAAGDASASNDKKGPMTLDPGTPPGRTQAFDPSYWSLIGGNTNIGGETFYTLQARSQKDFTPDDIKAAQFFTDHLGRQPVAASEAETLRSALQFFGGQKNTLILSRAQVKALGVKTLLVGGCFGGFSD